MAKEKAIADANFLQLLIENISMAINDARKKVALHILAYRNIVNIRKFYLLYPNCQSVSDNLSWMHICVL